MKLNNLPGKSLTEMEKYDNFLVFTRGAGICCARTYYTVKCFFWGNLTNF